MPTPLRAFLMLRDPRGEWEVGVHRDLEDLEAGWLRNGSGKGSTGVIHIGFSRPPSNRFDEVAARFPGAVLLTAPARFALPSSMANAKGPVAEVEGLPIYVAIDGWGYSGDEIEASLALGFAESAGITEFVPEPSFEAWVAGFVAHSSDAISALRGAGIYNDETYLIREVELPPRVRKEAGLFRYRQLIGDEMHDPCAVARASPPWFANRELESLDLTVRLSNVFTNFRFSKVQDLGRTDLTELLRVPNLGRKSIGDLLICLDRGLQAGPLGGFSTEVLDSNLLAGIRRSLLECEPRARDIVSRRMGLSGPPETLQQIADTHGVTRERIRQVESKTNKYLIRTEVWDDHLTEKLRAILYGREFPLPLAGVEALDPWFAGVAEHSDTMRYVLANLCDGAADIVEIDGVEYLGFLSQQQWEATIAEASKLLSAGGGKGWSEDHCMTIVGGLLPEKAREFRSLLWEKASRHCHFTDEGDGRRVLRAFGRGAEHVVEAVLLDSEAPLHFSEIAVRASARAGREIDPRRAHNAAAEVGLLLGRGTYGTWKHLPLSRQELSDLAEEATELITAGPDGRQWHADELLALLSERGSHIAMQADRYTLDAALRGSDDVIRLGRMVWAPKVDGAGEAARIEVRDAVVRILDQAGGPLSPRDIRQRMVALRGLGQHFQIVSADPIVRVGEGKWGLNDRDVGIRRSDQAEFVDHLVRLVTARRQGIHISELAGLGLAKLPAPSPEAIFSIASWDARLQTSAGQYLYLSSWEGPRRETVTEAAMAVLRVNEAIGFGNLAIEVERRLGRTFERSVLSSALQSMAILNAASEWTLAVSQPTEEEEEPLSEVVSA